MIEILDWTAWYTALVIITMIAALVRGAGRPEYIFLLALLSLIITGIVSPLEAFSGFTNPAVITIGALFVVAAAVQQSRLLFFLERFLFPKRAKTGKILLRIMGSASFLSSFLNNTPIVAMFTPQLQQWSKKIGIPVSKLLIPLSYAAIVGGTVTLIGTSTNLIVSEMLSDRGYAAFSLFHLAWIGIPATILVTVWFVLVGHRLLPERNPALGKGDVPASEDRNHTVLEVARAENGNYKYRQAIVENRVFEGNFAFAGPLGKENWPSGVYMKGQSRHYRSKKDQRKLFSLKDNRSLGTMVIITLMIGLAALGVLSVYVTVISAAGAMILTGSLHYRNIVESIHLPILIVIASALGIGSALETTGLAEVLAFTVIGKAGTMGVVFVLIGLYLMTNLLTELITNNAAAVLMIPVAITVATSLGIDVQAAGTVVAVAASASFLSPIGYQTNLMVMQPGGYRFTDFFKAGFPVTIILMVVTISVVYMFWI